MFEFGTLITILITIILGYITLYFAFKHQLDEIESSNRNDNKHKNNIIKRIRFINIFFPILIIIILFLYFLPEIKSIKIQIDFSSMIKIFPFKKGFFDNKNFEFSYITGVFFSIIIIMLFIIYSIATFLSYVDHKIITSVIIIFAAIFISHGLIWANYYISTFLNYCIIHYFELLSIILNILAYVIISIVLLIVCEFVYDLL